jgi:hypothetical protein
MRPGWAGSPRRVLGVDAALDGVAALAQVGLREGQRLALRDRDLQLHEVEPGHHLRHRVLDLQARVHLEEVGLRSCVHQELEGARVRVAGLCTRATASAPMRARSSG